MLMKSFISSQFEEAFLKMHRAKEDEIKALQQFWRAVIEDYRNENAKEENKDCASQYDEAKEPIAQRSEMSKEEWRALRGTKLNINNG